MSFYNYAPLLVIAIATKVFIRKLPATRGVWVIIGKANDERGSWASYKTLIGVHAFDHASHAPIKVL